MKIKPFLTGPRSLARIAALLAVPVLISGCGGGSGGSSSDGPNGGGGQPAPPAAPLPAGAGLANTGCRLSYTGQVVTPGTGVDPMLSSQWHLANDGTVTGLAGEDVRASQAWTTTKGDNIRVAVIDDAIEVTHIDLAQNVVANQSYDYRTASRGGIYPMPCVSSDSHGTAVAGLITARDGNATFGAGVAPRAGLVGYNALATSLEADIADALNRALDLNAVYNNSWGSPDDGLLHSASSAFMTAINNGITRGRAGKGAIYVFPGGNGGCYTSDTSGNCVSENSNYDGYTNQLGIITACATDSSGKQPYYGERGANVLVCGPSSGEASSSDIRTTALNDRSRADFGGTSASTPIVAGVTALMLAANPQLTWRDVQLILARTARKNDVGDSEWTTGAGLNFNPKYGFGVADAASAVAAARTWTSVGGSSTLQSCGPFTASPRTALPDPSGNQVYPVNSTVNAAGCAIRQIEFVEIRFSATHPSSGDLQVRLTSPAGQISELADARFCYNGNSLIDCGSYNNVHFGSVRHLDEPVTTAGSAVWTLQVTDMATQDTGSFDQWSIKFYGR